MKLWIDNTGLQSAGACLEGRAERSGSVDDLLQLGAQLIFAERIVVNGFEPAEVAARTQTLVNLLGAFGFPKEDLQIIPATKSEYGAACEVAALEAAEELTDSAVPGGDAESDLKPADLPRSVQTWSPGFLQDVLGDDSRFDADARDAVLSKGAPHAVEFMIRSSRTLRGVVKDWVTQAGTGWGEAHTERANGLLRAYLNRRLAEMNGATYAPAVGRATLLRKGNESGVAVLRHVLAGMDELVDQLRPKPVGAPAVSSALVRASRGEPRGVIESAIRMRVRANKTRQWLSKLALEGDRSTAEGLEKLDEGRAELEEYIGWELNPRSRPRLRTAFDSIALFGTVPIVVRVKTDAIANLVRYRLSRSKLLVLSELSRLAVHGDYKEDPNYEKLIHRSTHRR